MQLALSGTELSDGEPISGLIECARELGIGHIELWYPSNTARAGVSATLEDLARAEVRVACVSTGSELYRRGGSPRDQQLLLEGIELAHRCGATLVNTYFGYDVVRDDARAIATYRTLLEPCLRRAAVCGVTILLENEFNAFGVDDAASDITRRAASLRALFEAVQRPQFRLNFDPCNFYCAGVDPLEAYERLRCHVAYCHVKDGQLVRNRDAPDPNWKTYQDSDRLYRMRPLGDGDIPWDRLLPRLRADGYDGFVTLEPHAADHHRWDAWRQAARFVREAWQKGRES